MKFKIGDKVMVRKNLKEGRGYGSDVFMEEMKEFRGKIVTIDKVCKDGYYIKEDNNVWNYTDEMLEKVEYTYEDLKKSPIGTKITFENKEVLVKDDENYFENTSRSRIIWDLKNLKDNCSDLGKIIKIEEPTYETVYESKPEILDEEEKRYLRGVIRPFRDKTIFIKKFVFSTGKAKITIKTDDNGDIWYIGLPLFQKDKMYKNMEDDKEYTLEELGL